MRATTNSFAPSSARRSKRSSLNKLQGTPGKEDKVLLAESAVNQSEEALEISKVDFETVSARVLKEVARFKKEKAADMKTCVMDYITLQIQYNKKMELIWEEMIPNLEIGGGGDGGGNNMNNSDDGSGGGGGGGDSGRTVRTNSELASSSSKNKPPPAPASEDLVGV